jgi:hypothetical protein
VQRPPEYEGLLRIGSFKEAATNADSIAQFLRTAEEMSTAAAHPIPDSARFVLAYEGAFNVVMAVLEHFGVRPGDAGGGGCDAGHPCRHASGGQSTHVDR